jgi:peptidoglycan hydrolase-like protein with peptidoglycan-binding domain
MQSKQIAIAVAAAFVLAAPAFSADDARRDQRSQDSMSNPSHGDAARGAGMSQSGGQTQSSAAVREAQQALQQKGFDVGPIDGVMGPKTSAALREFQQAQGLKSSGRLDQQTLSALNVQADIRSSGASARDAMSANSGRRGVSGASSGPSVSSDATSPSPSSTQSGKTGTTGAAQGRAARTPSSTDAAPSTDASSGTSGIRRDPAMSSDKTSPSPESTSSGATPRTGG